VAMVWCYRLSICGSIRNAYKRIFPSEHFPEKVLVHFHTVAAWKKGRQIPKHHRLEQLEHALSR